MTIAEAEALLQATIKTLVESGYTIQTRQLVINGIFGTMELHVVPYNRESKS